MLPVEFELLHNIEAIFVSEKCLLTGSERGNFEEGFNYP